MAGFSRKLDDQQEMQQKPGTPGKSKMEPPIQIVMDPQDPSLNEVVPVKAAEPKAKPAAEAGPLKIVMDDAELS